MDRYPCVDYTALVSRTVTARQREVVSAGLPVARRDRFIIGTLAVLATLVFDLVVYLVLRILASIPVIGDIVGLIPLPVVLFAFVLALPVAALLSGRLVKRQDSGLESWREIKSKRAAAPSGTLWVGVQRLELPDAGTVISMPVRTVRTHPGEVR